MSLPRSRHADPRFWDFMHGRDLAVRLRGNDTPLALDTLLASNTDLEARTIVCRQQLWGPLILARMTKVQIPVG